MKKLKESILFWPRLKSMLCPRCGGPLMKASNEILFFDVKCSICEFFIRGETFNNIVNKLYKRKKDEPEKDNLSELNNLGTEELPEEEFQYD